MRKICLAAPDVANFQAAAMAEIKSAEQTMQPALTVGRRAKRAGLYVLFGTILFIPRIRRLRRRVWAWTAVRVGAAGCGCGLVWRYAHLRSGPLGIVCGVMLLAFALVIRAKPLQKSVDAIAGELGALITLNGGRFLVSPGASPVEKAQIFVCPEKMVVHGPGNRHLLTIPFAKVRTLTAHASANGGRAKHQPWEVEIDWADDSPHITRFVFEGPFAEHLAGVAESTLRSRWKKELPVIL